MEEDASLAVFPWVVLCGDVSVILMAEGISDGYVDIFHLGMFILVYDIMLILFNYILDDGVGIISFFFVSQ